MNRVMVVVGVLCVGILAVAGGATAASVKEGKWSMTTVIQMDGADPQAAEAMREMENLPPEQQAMMQRMMGGPGGAPGMSTTTTQCITNDHPVPESKGQEDCQQTHTITGNTVEFEVVCADSRSTGEVTYKGDSMKGTITSTQTARGQQRNMTIDISGEYVGPCS